MHDLPFVLPLLMRRVRDSNSWALEGPLVFKTSAINHSANPPSYHFQSFKDLHCKTTLIKYNFQIFLRSFVLFIFSWTYIAGRNRQEFRYLIYWTVIRRSGGDEPLLRFFCTEGETRTRKPCMAADFESAMYTIPSLRHIFVGREGFEPSASSVSARCSGQTKLSPNFTGDE